MSWTTENPTTPGWYWYRDGGQNNVPTMPYVYSLRAT